MLDPKTLKVGDIITHNNKHYLGWTITYLVLEAENHQDFNESNISYFRITTFCIENSRYKWYQNKVFKNINFDLTDFRVV